MFNRKQQNDEFKKYVSELKLIEDIKYQTSMDLSKTNKLGVIIDVSSPKDFISSVISALDRLPSIESNAGRDASNEDLENVLTGVRAMFASLGRKLSAKKAKQAPDDDALKNADVSVIRRTLVRAIQPMADILQAKAEIMEHLNSLSQSPADEGKMADYVNRINAMSIVNPKKFRDSIGKMVNEIEGKIYQNMKIEDKLFYKSISNKLKQVCDDMVQPEQKKDVGLTK